MFIQDKERIKTSPTQFWTGGMQSMDWSNCLYRQIYFSKIFSQEFKIKIKLSKTKEEDMKNGNYALLLLITSFFS